MAIRDRLRRAVRRSDTSDASSASDSKTTTATSTANTSQTSLSSSPPIGATVTQSPTNATQSSTLKRFPWSGSSSSSNSSSSEEKAAKKQQKKEEKEKARRKRLHPSQRPLTSQNLKHQAMLNQFTMTFGATQFDPCSGSIYGISPCGTRAPSIIDVIPSVEHDEGLMVAVQD